MAKKKHTPEEIINKLREAEVVIAAGSTVAVAAPVAGVSSDPSLMTDYSLREDAADPTRPFGPWFYRIVVNDAIKATQRRDRTTTVDHAEDTGGSDESTDPEAAAVLNEERKAVHRGARTAYASAARCSRDAVLSRSVRGRDGRANRTHAGHR